MGLKRLLDTNVVLYHLAGRLAAPLPPADYLLSIIFELELLSYPGLGTEAEERICAFLDEVTIVQLNPEVCAATIDFRRRYRLKLPDAIIVGTAKTVNAELVTNDEALLKLAGIAAVSMELKVN